MQRAYQLQQAGQLPAAEEVCRQVLVREPEHAEANKLLGLLRINSGRPASALDAIQRALETVPDDPQSHFFRGLALKMLDCTDDAVAGFKHALSLAPRNANAHMNLAITLTEMGHFEEAIKHFQEVISLRPDFAMAHFQLAHIRNHLSSNDEINAMKSIYNHPKTPVADRVLLAYGLGSALEKHGAYAEAFECFQAAHRLKKQSVPFDLAKQRRFFQALMDTFNKDHLTQTQAAGPADELPIFIVGMPRSGTTLAEQILASHPDVRGAGELGYMEEMVRTVIQLTGRPLVAGWHSVSAADIHALGVSYLDKLSTHADGARRVTDTTPMNFLYIGLIASALPGARLVHCRRNAMDTCLSIYQQPLADSHAYAHDLQELGGFYRLYEDLMHHWHSVLPSRIYDLNYEALVTDSEAEIRKLLSYCGLPFHEACLNFHATERSVRTPSTSQVRQPMYTDSVERWKRYETQLLPLKAILQ